MAELTAQNYQDALDATKPGSGASDEERTFALQIIQEFEDQHAAKQGAPAAPAQPNLAAQIDPRFSTVPQALAVQPATTDPAGDDAASEKWLIDGGKNAKGTVIYYEPPLSVAKKELLENPSIGRALYPGDDRILDPQEIANLKPSDTLFDDYKNLKWRETANAAAKAGKTVYRYSRAPYLQGDGAASTINTLGLKAIGSIEPIISGATSFIGGVDKAGSFGAGNRLANATEGAPEKPPVDNPSPPFEFVGGTTGAKTGAEYRALSTEEHPFPSYGGQALGMLSHWSPSNQLFQAATNTGARGAAALGGGVLARLGASTLSAGAAGAVDQGIREGVNAAGDLAEHGETPITLQGAASNMGNAALLTGGIGGAFEGASSLAKAGADRIANGPHFRGIPGQLERGGVKFSVAPPPFGGPKLSPETQAVVDAAKVEPLIEEGKLATNDFVLVDEKTKAVMLEAKADVKPVDPIADPVADPIIDTPIIPK